ncbi:MAG: superinfection immunity protein [Janthinobacterium lividum]
MSYQQPYGYPAPPPLVQPYRCSTAHVVTAWVVAVITGLYMLPWAIAATRNRRNVGTVALVDALLGWSLIGWIVALVMACGSDQPVVVVHSSYGPPPQTPPPVPPALPAEPVYASYPEPTRVDPLGSEPTQQLPPSSWEPDHRR